MKKNLSFYKKKLVNNISKLNLKFWFENMEDKKQSNGLDMENS